VNFRQPTCVVARIAGRHDRVSLPDDAANALFRRADAALYAAKRAGRNRVELLEPDTEDLLPELKARVRAARQKSSGEPSPRPWSKRRA
ncbi:MAG: hypothetical protein EHM67_09765, partial [Hyphomicrobiaceae bacterium]